jgi:hypothetical protein
MTKRYEFEATIHLFDLDTSEKHDYKITGQVANRDDAGDAAHLVAALLETELAVADGKRVKRMTSKERHQQ